MARKAKTHPADQANAELLARAERFEVSLFLGTGRYARASAATLAEARRLLAAHKGTARKPLIYGVTADGRTALVTGDAEPPASKPFGKPFNARRAARAALGEAAVEDVHFRSVLIDDNSEDGWTWLPTGVPVPATPQPEPPPVASEAPALLLRRRRSLRAESDQVASYPAALK